jgi:hypothetical protein
MDTLIIPHNVTTSYDHHTLLYNIKNECLISLHTSKRITYSTIELASFCQEHQLPYQRTMSQQQNVQLSNRGGTIQITLSTPNNY